MTGSEEHDSRDDLIDDSVFGADKRAYQRNRGEMPTNIRGEVPGSDPDVFIKPPGTIDVLNYLKTPHYSTRPKRPSGSGHGEDQGYAHLFKDFPGAEETAQFTSDEEGRTVVEHRGHAYILPFGNPNPFDPFVVLPGSAGELRSIYERNADETIAGMSLHPELELGANFGGHGSPQSLNFDLTSHIGPIRRDAYFTEKEAETIEARSRQASENFYRNIKPEDKPELEKVVDTLHQHRLNVSLRGLVAIFLEDYETIKLVIKPSQGYAIQSDSWDSLVRSLQEVGQIVDNRVMKRAPAAANTVHNGSIQLEAGSARITISYEESMIESKYEFRADLPAPYKKPPSPE